MLAAGDIVKNETARNKEAIFVKLTMFTRRLTDLTEGSLHLSFPIFRMGELDKQTQHLALKT